MGLKKYKLGELIELTDERNSYGYTNFYGLNITKEFMPTWADTEGLDESKYKVVRKKRFVFSGMQTGRDKCIRISMYDGEEPIIVSPTYTTFEISKENIVLPEYFFMLFLSKEKDRFGAFCSDGSIRSNLDWERFCDIDITLPSLSRQRKYVNVYLALQNNLVAYQSKADELKLVCDGYLDKLKAENGKRKIGEFIEQYDKRNTDNQLQLNSVKGISTEKSFIDTKANMNGVSLTSYKVVETDTFVYVPDTSRRGDKMAIALNRGEEPLLVSSIYTTFKSKDTSRLLPEYLFMFFDRPEFDRYARFNSWGSAREVFTMEDMNDVEIPIPDITVQREIVNIHKCYIERQRIAEALKAQLKDICPVLIRGSLQD
ncbi:restriction endonuclease subunit S [Prevotella dentasini]|uniref:restriction endonuclease subunit S n=1 Tax=Prevotella dentasini TaxID=589537 RepID=UPI000565F99E|nr:restriction endonuclease subunit S [Prevotella dentasini]